MTANAKENAVAMMEVQNKMYNVLTPEQKNSTTLILRNV